MPDRESIHNPYTPPSALLAVGEADSGQLVSRSRAALACLWAVVVSDVMALGAGLLYVEYLASLDPGAAVSELELVPSELALAFAVLAQFVALIAAAIFFMRWFHRAYSNLARVADAPTRYPSWWAVWGFLIPFLNLIRPQQLMREIWDTSTGVWASTPERVAGLRQPADRVNLWWGCFIASNLLGNVAARVGWKASTAGESLGAAGLDLAATGFDVVAALVAIALVRATTALQLPLLDRTD